MVTLVTGAAGFVGRACITGLLGHGIRVVGSVRHQAHLDRHTSCPTIAINLEDAANLDHVLSDVGCIIHAAARVHVHREDSIASLEAFRAVNVEGTRKLAEQAAACGVRRFVFLSSIGVNGGSTSAEKPFRVDDAPRPSDAYSQSKWEAENALRRIAARSDLEVVVLRPPLIYGRNAPGNFRRLVRAIRVGIPIPLGSVKNLRSFISVDNLVDLILLCAQHPAAANRTFLVCDGLDLSTAGFIRQTAAAMGRRDPTVAFPENVLHWADKMLGGTKAFRQLCGSLRIDSSETRTTLGWIPPHSLEESLRRAFCHEQSQSALSAAVNSQLNSEVAPASPRK